MEYGKCIACVTIIFFERETISFIGTRLIKFDPNNMRLTVDELKKFERNYYERNKNKRNL